ncbi:Ig-like domain-containing protein [Thermoleptolyngbya sp. PKUAC-SCTB121]|uniref:Ig-like domain-containing protein n=1 Tax=Thermoleptolyngbya sp. PKUAC-SCTB121 TaxID=2811482 RepID=UPI001963CA39|nr:Ig-like domain-containing protein [Thermoleptolyngbya sp. PKUAC-SCTB121]
MSPITCCATVVFVDAATPDYQTLIAGIHPDIDVQILDPGQDGIQQITDYLAGRSNISSVHIISHGSTGSLHLGSTVLNRSTLAHYSTFLQSWSAALTEDADILLYGCNIASGEGSAFVQQLAALTGANLAASTNLTGSAALGGDWALEYTTGSIEASNPFNADALNSYKGILPAIPTGSIVVLRTGDGSALLTNAATAVFLDVYDTSGSLLQSIAMPTTVDGSNRRLTLSGTADLEGGLSLSTDGRYLVLAGYDASVGTLAIASTTSTAVNRVIARVDMNGTVDTSTHLTSSFSGNSVRSVASVDGSSFWVAGVSSNNTGGIHYVPYGDTGTRLTTVDGAVRSVGIFDGRLYTTAGSSTSPTHVGLNTIGTGLPESGSIPITAVPGTSSGNSPFEFVLLDRDATVAGVDTLYIADRSPDASGGGIRKYSFDGTTWTLRQRLVGQFSGLTGQVVGSTVELYATRGNGANNSLVRIVDTAAFNADINATLTVLATAGANQVFRGVAFSPSAVVNQPPVANDGTLTTDEDTAFSGTLSGSDPEGAALTYSIVNQPASGTVTLTDAATGAYIFTPNANFNGGDSFTFSVNDGVNDSGTATVTITVNPVNDAPTAAGVIVTTNEDEAVSGFLLGADVDGDMLTYEIVTAPTKGSVTITNAATGAFTYTPNADANGADSFTYRVFDGTVYSNTATVTVAIAPINDAPVATDGSLTTTRNQPQNGTVAAADVDGDMLTYSVVTGPASGTLTSFDAATGAFTYLPNAGHVGPDSFSFQANDGSGAANALSNVATVSIVVNFGNNAPVANGDSLVTNEDAAVLGTLSGTDGDNDPLIYAIATGPSQGSITAFDPNTGAFTYTPNPNANGSDSFSFRVFDGFEESEPATITITITPVNDAPVANAATLNTRTGKTEAGVLTATDVEGDPLSFSIVSAPTNGTVTIINALTGEYTYTPNAGFSGSDSFTFRANDGTDDSAPATVSITVAPNSAPVATNGSLNTRVNAERSGRLVATDPDGDIIRFSIVTAPSYGSVVITNTATGTYTYTPNPGYSGPDSFVFQVTDDVFNATGTISVLVAANQAPVLTAPLPRRGATERLPFVAQLPLTAFVDPDGDSLTYTATLANGAPLPAWLTFNAATRTFSGTPANGDVGTIALRVVATDPSGVQGTGTFTLTVLNINDAPVLQKPIGNRTAVAGQGFGLMLESDTFVDIDAGDVLTYTASLSDGRPLPAWLTFDPVTRTFSGTPAGGNAGSYRIVVRATDRSGMSAVDEFDLLVRSDSGLPPQGPKKLNRMKGSPRPDRIRGTRRGDRIEGFDGNDVIEGLGGDDYILGGAGIDRLVGGGGNDTLVGGRGADVLVGGAGNDVLIAGETTDFLRGFQEATAIWGAIATNVLKGGKGNDLLVGGGRSDLMIGGAGRDTFVLAKHGGADVIRDFKVGVDVIGLAKGLTFRELRIQQLSQGARIWLNGSDEVIAELSGVQANKLTAASFVPLTRLPL